jgi:hypothetical protein
MGMNIDILKSFEKYVKNRLNEDIKHSKYPYPYSSSILIELEFTEPKDFKVLQTGYPAKKALEKYIKDKNITFIGIDQEIEYNTDYDDADKIDYINDEDVEFYYYIGNDDKAIDSSINDLRKEAGDQVAEDFINLIADELEEWIKHQ